MRNQKTKHERDSSQKAILRTWDTRKCTYEDTEVKINKNHVFEDGPYQDTVPFSVGSNQEILPYRDE